MNKYKLELLKKGYSITENIDVDGEIYEFTICIKDCHGYKFQYNKKYHLSFGGLDSVLDHIYTDIVTFISTDPKVAFSFREKIKTII